MHKNLFLLEICKLLPTSKYLNWYVQIIQNALTRQNGLVTKKSRKILKEQLQYVEAHHILPRCLCVSKEQETSNENLVLLTAREHFICHLLLFKACPNSIKLAKAFDAMSTRDPSPNKTRYTSRLFQNTKKQIAKLRSEKYSGENHPRWGVTLTDETKNKISKKLKGVPLKESQKENIGIATRARYADPDFVHPNKGKKYSDEYKQNMSVACSKIKKTDEWNKKNSESNSGRSHIANTITKERKRPKREEAIKMVNESNGVWIFLATSKPIPDYVEQL